jgi:hypothetical protein
MATNKENLLAQSLVDIAKSAAPRIFITGSELVIEHKGQTAKLSMNSSTVISSFTTSRR